jgi:mannan endo-1,4-beta-mannosidase
MKKDNCDMNLDFADVVIIKCYLINNKEYSITKQGLINADVNESGNGLNI